MTRAQSSTTDQGIQRVLCGPPASKGDSYSAGEGERSSWATTQTTEDHHPAAGQVSKAAWEELAENRGWCS